MSYKDLRLLQATSNQMRMVDEMDAAKEDDGGQHLMLTD